MGETIPTWAASTTAETQDLKAIILVVLGVSQRRMSILCGAIVRSDNATVVIKVGICHLENYDPLFQLHTAF